jgi:hypothetical protein
LREKAALVGGPPSVLSVKPQRFPVVLVNRIYKGYPVKRAGKNSLHSVLSGTPQM